MKLSNLNADDAVMIDGGFDCMRPGLAIVEKDGGGLFVKCSHGKHYLEGQENEHGELVGVSEGPSNKSTQELYAERDGSS